MRPSYCLLVLFLVGSAHAQVSGGAISGTISDPVAAAVAGAEVAIENLATRETRRLVSSSAGLYSASNLAPGVYQLSVAAPGFSRLVRTNLTYDDVRPRFGRLMEALFRKIPSGVGRGGQLRESLLSRTMAGRNSAFTSRSAMATLSADRLPVSA